MIQPVTQSPGAHTCGQCCVAMMLGITLAEAVASVGKKGGTGPADLRPSLLAGGLKLRSGVRCSGMGTAPAYETGLLKQVNAVQGNKKSRDTHWMLWAEGRLFCPDRGEIMDPDWVALTTEGRGDVITTCYPVVAKEVVA